MNLRKLVEATLMGENLEVYERFFIELSKHGFKSRGTSFEAEGPGGVYLAVEPGNTYDRWKYNPKGKRFDVLLSTASVPALGSYDPETVLEDLPDLAFDVAEAATSVAEETTTWPRPNLVKQLKDRAKARRCTFDLIPDEKDQSTLFPLILTTSDPKCSKKFLQEIVKYKIAKVPIIKAYALDKTSSYPNAVFTEINPDVLAPAVFMPLSSYEGDGASALEFMDGSELLRRYRIAMSKSLARAIS